MFKIAAFTLCFSCVLYSFDESERQLFQMTKQGDFGQKPKMLQTFKL